MAIEKPTYEQLEPGWFKCSQCNRSVRRHRLSGHTFLHKRDAEIAAAGGPEAYVENRLRAEGRIP